MDILGRVVALLSLALFGSAALLFLVQPMLAKWVLPLFGSTPAVWTASLLFFQAALLGGYAYAHALAGRLGPPRATLVHGALVLASLLALPIGLEAGAAPPPEGSPVLALVLLLAGAAGLPFFVLSATAPLLQRWLASTDHPAGRDPYVLYRASNLGSLLGLLAYPLLLEPALAVEGQAALWTATYAGVAALVLGCALGLRRAGPLAEPEAGAGPPAGPPSPWRLAHWVALALVPSSLVLGVTSFLTTDLAPVPLLWVVPLALYLLTFVLAFSPGRGGALAARAGVLGAPPAVIGLAACVVWEPDWPLAVLAAAHLATFSLVALACHGALARDRPAARHLTGFYLAVAVGGVLGGALNALAAPVLFDSYAEYPLALVLACLLWPGLLRGATWQLRVVDRISAVALALVVGGILVGGASDDDATGQTLYAERNFFGVHEVRATLMGLQRLVHGTTLHGSQVPGTTIPTTYYHPGSPVAQLLDAVGPRVTRRTAVIGLGAGTMACHARRGERWTFYEIDPKVERIARDPNLFTYLRDCPGAHDVVLGDGRLSLARARPGAFGLVVADAFSSDAIPVHLVTREALALYESRLARGGVLAFHVSNRYLDLDPVLGALARGAGLTCLVGDSDRPGTQARGATSSTWVAMARRPADLGSLGRDARWRPCRSDPGVAPWTDSYSNVLELVRRAS